MAAFDTELDDDTAERPACGCFCGCRQPVMGDDAVDGMDCEACELNIHGGPDDD